MTLMVASDSYTYYVDLVEYTTQDFASKEDSESIEVVISTINNMMAENRSSYPSTLKRNLHSAEKARETILWEERLLEDKLNNAKHAKE